MCKGLHLGKRNQMHSYKMWYIWLSKTTYERDLGNFEDHKLKMSHQCVVTAKKVIAILGCIDSSLQIR